jgi:hypothetical protein
MGSPPPFPPPRACSSYTSRIAMFASLLPIQLRHSRSLCSLLAPLEKLTYSGDWFSPVRGSKIPYCSNRCSWPYIRSFVLSLFSTEKVSSGIEYPVHQNSRSYGYVRRIDLTLSLKGWPTQYPTFNKIIYWRQSGYMIT